MDSRFTRYLLLKIASNSGASPGVVVAVIIVLLVVLIGLGAGWYFYTKRKADNYRKFSTNLALEDEDDEKNTGLNEDFDRK